MKKLSIMIILFMTPLLILSGCSTQSGTASTDTNESVVLASSTVEKNYALKDLKKCSLAIDGMWCASCSTGIEYALKESEGVVDARIDLVGDQKGIGQVIYDPNLISPEDIVNIAKPFEAVVLNDEPATSLQLQ